LLAYELGDVDVRLRRDLARDDDEPRRDQRLAGTARSRVVREDRIEHRVRDLVGDLVGVALGYGLRCEEELTGCHGAEGYWNRLLRLDPDVQPGDAALLRAPGDDGPDVLEVVAERRIRALAAAERLRRQLDQRRQLLDVGVDEERRLRRDAGALDGVLVGRVVNELRTTVQRRGCARAVRDDELAT